MPRQVGDTLVLSGAGASGEFDVTTVATYKYGLLLTGDFNSCTVSVKGGAVIDSYENLMVTDMGDTSHGAIKTATAGLYYFTCGCPYIQVLTSVTAPNSLSVSLFARLRP